MLSHSVIVQFFKTLWTVARQAPLSMGFYRQEYWSRFLFPSPGDLCDPGIKARSPALQVDYLPFKPPWNPKVLHIFILKSPMDPAVIDIK